MIENTGIAGAAAIIGGVVVKSLDFGIALVKQRVYRNGNDRRNGGTPVTKNDCLACFGRHDKKFDEIQETLAEIRNDHHQFRLEFVSWKGFVDGKSARGKNGYKDSSGT